MSDTPILTLSGMANRFALDAVPLGKAFEAVDVMFSNTGDIIFPRYGYELVKAANAHSVNESSVGTLYVDDGVLKLLADTPVSLKTGCGDNPMSYSRPIGDTIYFSNGTITGRYVKGETMAGEWGIAVPPTPTCAPVTYGGMYAGMYHVVITYIGDEESAAGPSTLVNVPEGGGIMLTAFPASPPAYVTKFAVYVSSINGSDLYYYNEYPIATSSVHITKNVSDSPLQTQFLFPPAPPSGSRILDHYGRIYYTDGFFLNWTHIDGFGPRYSLQEALSSIQLDSSIQTVVNCPGVIYIGTLFAQYSLRDIDGEGPPTLEQIRDIGSIKGSEVYHENGKVQYYMGKQGLVACTPEGAVDVTADQVAIPYYTSGTSTILYKDGMEYLLFIGFSGIQNPLASEDYNTVEWNGITTQSSAWAINLSATTDTNSGQIKTYPVSKFRLSVFNRISGKYGSNSSGIYEITGITDAGAAISGYVKTGKMNFKNQYVKRVPDLYVKVKGGKCKLRISSDNSKRLVYAVAKTTIMQTVKLDLARGAKGDLWQFEIENINGSEARVSYLKPRVVTIPRQI